MPGVHRRSVDEQFLDGLLGLESSKIGFYAEVKQKIQELEQINLTLRTKSNELQAVFDAIRDAVMIYDSRLQVQSRNHVCPGMFPQGSLLGMPCSAIFHPDTPQAGQECPVEAALNGEAREMAFHSHGRASELFFEATATPIPDAFGRPTRALVFVRNVTDRKRQEMKLHQAARMSSIGMLAAGVAHEINNPLTSVAGYAEGLLRRFREKPDLADHPDLDSFPKYLEVIVREAYRCKTIIESLLSFSRKTHKAVGPVGVVELVDEVLQLLRHRARAEQVDIVEELRDGLPPVFGDANELRQVIMNLTINALQAMEGPGTLRISTRADDRHLRLCISDTGKGIPAEQVDQIWDPFFTTKGVGEGLGLGLSVTYNIVKKHGGRIDVHSQNGKGTRFTVCLPIRDEDR